MLVKHTVTLDTEVESDFECRACGFSGTATVLTRGVGIAHSVAGLDREVVTREAQDEAHLEAKHRAAVTLGLARCPRCHRRSRTARAGFVAFTALGAAALLGLAYVVWAWAGGFRWINGGLITLGVAGFVRDRRRRFLLADASVGKIRERPRALPRATAMALPPLAPPADALAPGDEPRLLGVRDHDA